VPGGRVSPIQDLGERAQTGIDFVMRDIRHHHHREIPIRLHHDLPETTYQIQHARRSRLHSEGCALLREDPLLREVGHQSRPAIADLSETVNSVVTVVQ
jgi:hypothetical protein